jgi:hypothetical protein
MKTYKATKIKGKKESYYQFTCDGQPIGYCAERNCKHKTSTEASECYRAWCNEQNKGLTHVGLGIDQIKMPDIIIQG